MLRYRTEIQYARMPMPVASTSMPMPSYAKTRIFTLKTGSLNMDTGHKFWHWMGWAEKGEPRGHVLYELWFEIIFLSSSFWVFLYYVAVFSTGLWNNLHVNSQPPTAMSPTPKSISQPLKAKLWTLQLLVQVTLCIFRKFHCLLQIVRIDTICDKLSIYSCLCPAMYCNKLLTIRKMWKSKVFFCFFHCLQKFESNNIFGHFIIIS